MTRRLLVLAGCALALPLLGCSAEAGQEAESEPPPSRIVLSDTDSAACSKVQDAEEAVKAAMDKGETHPAVTIADELVAAKGDIDQASALASPEVAGMMRRVSAAITLVADRLYEHNTWDETAVTATLSALDDVAEWCWRR